VSLVDRRSEVSSTKIAEYWAEQEILREKFKFTRF